MLHNTSLTSGTRGPLVCSRVGDRPRLTLDAPLEEGLAALAGPDAVVVAGGVVVTHGAVVEVRLPAG